MLRPDEYLKERREKNRLLSELSRLSFQEVRVLGPRRATAEEARKDGCRLVETGSAILCYLPSVQHRSRLALLGNASNCSALRKMQPR